MSCTNDEYAEIDEKGARTFVMDENVCYEGSKQRCSDLNNSAGNKQRKDSLALPISCSKKAFLLLFVLVIALLLGTVCACVVLALEISTLKSEMFSFQKETQQSQNASEMNFEQQIIITFQQLSFAENQQNEKIQHLNACLKNSALECLPPPVLLSLPRQQQATTG